MTVSNVAAFSRGNDDARGFKDVEIFGSGAGCFRFAIAPDAAL
jgi:hypothetical protein